MIRLIVMLVSVQNEVLLQHPDKLDPIKILRKQELLMSFVGIHI